MQWWYFAVAFLVLTSPETQTHVNPAAEKIVVQKMNDLSVNVLRRSLL